MPAACPHPALPVRQVGLAACHRLPPSLLGREDVREGQVSVPEGKGIGHKATLGLRQLQRCEDGLERAPSLGDSAGPWSVHKKWGCSLRTAPPGAHLLPWSMRDPRAEAHPRTPRWDCLSLTALGVGRGSGCWVPPPCWGGNRMSGDHLLSIPLDPSTFDPNPRKAPAGACCQAE